MGENVFQKPFVQKVEFDAKVVTAASAGGGLCYGWMANKTETWGVGTCQEGTTSYVGINSAATPT